MAAFDKFWARVVAAVGFPGDDLQAALQVKFSLGTRGNNFNVEASEIVAKLNFRSDALRFSSSPRCVPFFVKSFALGLVLGPLLLLSPNAFACPTSESVSTIFFDELPPQSEAPIATRVKIVRLLPTQRESLVHRSVAQVEKVVVGSIPSQIITVISPNSDCDPPPTLGASGLVLGALRQVGSRDFEFIAETETVGKKRARLRK
jgi:hypothetical protein